MNPAVILGIMTFLFLFFGYMGVPVAFALMAGVLAWEWIGRVPSNVSLQ